MNLHIQWIVGFVDGEGCFHVSIVTNKTMKLGFQVKPSFRVVQHQRDIQVLYALKSYFGCGFVKKNHGNQYCFYVKNSKHLYDIIIPFFEKHQLKTKKNIDFKKFRFVVRSMMQGKHLIPEGLNELQKFVNQWQNIKKEEITSCNDNDESNVR